MVKARVLLQVIVGIRSYWIAGKAMLTKDLAFAG